MQELSRNKSQKTADIISCFEKSNPHINSFPPHDINYEVF